MGNRLNRLSRELETPITGISREAIEFTGLMLALAETVGVKPGERALRWYECELARVEREKKRKCQLLFGHFELREGDWESLARTLADRFIPGLSVTRDRSGAKQRWGPIETAVLRINLEEIQAQRPGRTLSDAARIAAKSPPWKYMIRGSRGWETLRRRAYEARPAFVDALRNAQMAHVDAPITELPIDRVSEDYIKRYYANRSAKS